MVLERARKRQTKQQTKQQTNLDTEIRTSTLAAMNWFAGDAAGGAGRDALMSDPFTSATTTDDPMDGTQTVADALWFHKRGRCIRGDGSVASCCKDSGRRSRPSPCSYCRLFMYVELGEKYGVEYVKSGITNRVMGACHLCTKYTEMNLGHVTPLSGVDCEFFGYTPDNIIGTCTECESLIGSNTIVPHGDHFTLDRAVGFKEVSALRQILCGERYIPFHNWSVESGMGEDDDITLLRVTFTRTVPCA